MDGELSAIVAFVTVKWSTSHIRYRLGHEAVGVVPIHGKTGIQHSLRWEDIGVMYSQAMLSYSWWLYAQLLLL